MSNLSSPKDTDSKSSRSDSFPWESMHPASLEKISSRDKELFHEFVWEWQRLIGGGYFDDLKKYLEKIDMKEFVGADYEKSKLDFLDAQRKGVLETIKFSNENPDKNTAITVGQMMLQLLVKMAKAMFEGRKAKLGDDMQTRADWRDAVFNILDEEQVPLDNWGEIWSMTEWRMEVEEGAGDW